MKKGVIGQQMRTDFKYKGSWPRTSLLLCLMTYMILWLCEIIWYKISASKLLF